MSEKTFPRMMLVWDDCDNKREMTVAYVCKDGLALTLRPNGSFYGEYKYCEELPEKTKRPMTHAEIFTAIRRDGAVVREAGGNYRGARNFWYSTNIISSFEICYNYTGTEADIWEEMEVEG